MNWDGFMMGVAITAAILGGLYIIVGFIALVVLAPVAIKIIMLGFVGVLVLGGLIGMRVSK